MNTTHRLSRSSDKKIASFFQRVFVYEKLNNWVGYILLGSLGLLFSIVLVKNMMAGLILFGAFAGLAFLIAGVSSKTFALYSVIIYTFSIEIIARLFLGGKILAGVYFDALLGVAFLSLIVSNTDVMQSLRSFSKHSIVLFYYFNFLYIPIQFFNPNSSSLGDNLMGVRKFLGYVFILFFTYTFFDSYDRIKKFINFLFGVCSLCALYGCIQQWHGLFNFELELIYADPIAFGLTFVNGDFRKYSTLSDSSIFGILMAVTGVFFSIITLYEKDFGKKLIFGIGSLLMILGMAYSATRTSYAALVGGACFYFLLTIDKTQTKIVAVGSTLFLLFMVYAPFYGSSTIYRFRTTFQGSQDESYKVRQRAWNFIQPYIQTHPIGGGLGTTGSEAVQKHPGHPLANFQPDSSYVKRAAETGWIGLLMICIFYFLTLWEGIRGYFTVKNKEMKVIYAACVSALFAFYVAEYAQQAIGGITDSMIYLPILSIILKLKTYDTVTAKAL